MSADVTERRLSILRDIVARHDTSAGERVAAEEAIRRIEERKACERAAAQRDAGRRGRLRVLGRRARVEAGPHAEPPTAWPPGWRGDRIAVAHDLSYDLATGALVVRWACPSCSAPLTRAIGRAEVARLEGRHGALQARVAGMTDGRVNQLCWPCARRCGG